MEGMVWYGMVRQEVWDEHYRLMCCSPQVGGYLTTSVMWKKEGVC